MKLFTFHIDSQMVERAETEEEAKAKIKEQIQAVHDNPPDIQTLDTDTELIKQCIVESSQVGELLQEEN